MITLAVRWSAGEKTRAHSPHTTIIPPSPSGLGCCAWNCGDSFQVGRVSPYSPMQLAAKHTLRFVFNFPSPTLSLSRHPSSSLCSGHRSAVTYLEYSDSGSVLLSGGRDTDVIVWDVTNEAGARVSRGRDALESHNVGNYSHLFVRPRFLPGLYRLRGHKGPILGCHFIEDRNMVVSCSKVRCAIYGRPRLRGPPTCLAPHLLLSYIYLQDTFIKFWDLDTQACIHTLVGHRSEVRRD